MLQVKHTMHMVVIIIIILIIAMHAHCHWSAETHETESQAQFIYISNTSWIFPGSRDPCTPTKPTTSRRLMVALSTYQRNATGY